MTCHVNNSADIYQHECRGSDTRMNNYHCVNETAANSLLTKRLKPSLQILQNAHWQVNLNQGTTSEH